MVRIPGSGGGNTTTGGDLQFEGAAGGGRGGDRVFHLSGPGRARHWHGDGALSGGAGADAAGRDGSDCTYGGGAECVDPHPGEDRDAIRRRRTGRRDDGVALGDEI